MGDTVAGAEQTNYTRSSPTEDELTVIYDAYRTARMNVIYYGAKLGKLQRLGLAVDLIVAIGTSSTVAALAVWDAPVMSVVRSALVGLTVLLVTIRPVLNIPRRVERYSKLYAAYMGVHSSFEAIVNEIRSSHVLSPESRYLAESEQKRLAQTEKDDDPAPDKVLIEQAYAQVNEEVPASSLWWPIATT
jgi:hypothetical protein